MSLVKRIDREEYNLNLNEQNRYISCVKFKEPKWSATL